MMTTQKEPCMLLLTGVTFLTLLCSCSRQDPPDVVAGMDEEGTRGGTFISVGTGGVTGVYYQVGGAIAKLVNAKKADYGLTVSFQATGGSVYNINALLNNSMEIGVAQSDRQYQAVKGLAEWRESGPRIKLRAICSMHPEAVTLVASVDSGILSLQDLRGKRVNIGNQGSGQRGNALDVLRTAGIDPQKDIQAESLKAAEAPRMLQDGRIDAFFYTVGHPAGAITEATAGRKPVRFIPITGMDALIAKAPYYAMTTIPVGLYPKATNTKAVETISVMTTVLSTTDVRASAIYYVTKELFENLDLLRTMHPAFASLQAKDMISKGISAPFHPGAIRYFREAGLME